MDLIDGVPIYLRMSQRDTGQVHNSMYDKLCFEYLGLVCMFAWKYALYPEYSFL